MNLSDADKKRLACCSDFRKALERGTDNEGYGALIYADDLLGGGQWLIGSDGLPPLTTCPWCGKQLPAPSIAKGATR